MRMRCLDLLLKPRGLRPIRRCKRIGCQVLQQAASRERIPIRRVAVKWGIGPNQLPRHHLLTHKSPTRASRLRLVQLLEEPRFLLGTNQRPPRPSSRVSSIARSIKFPNRKLR